MIWWLLCASSWSLLLVKGLVGAGNLSRVDISLGATCALFDAVLMLSSWIAHILFRVGVSIVVFAHLYLLSLVESCIFLVNGRLELVLNGSHDNLVSSGLIRHLFRTDSRARLLLWVLMGCRALLIGHSTFKIEDVVLDCWEWVVVAYIEAGSCPFFLLLTVHVDLNLRSLDAVCVDWSLLDVLSGPSSAISRIASSAHHFNSSIELFCTRNHLHCFVKHGYIADLSVSICYVLLFTTRSIVARLMGWAGHICSSLLLLLLDLLLDRCTRFIIHLIDLRARGVGNGSQWRILNHVLRVGCIVVAVGNRCACLGSTVRWLLRCGRLLLSEIELLSLKWLSHAETFLSIRGCWRSNCHILIYRRYRCFLWSLSVRCFRLLLFFFSFLYNDCSVLLKRLSTDALLLCDTLLMN